jgi:flagellar M-ring protein FliF
MMANQILEQFLPFLNSPSRRQGLFIFIILLASLAGFGSLIFWNNRPDYQVLFSNLSQEDAGEMLGKLKEKKISYELSGNGTTILVPREQVYDLRLSLAAEGLPKGGGVGFEVFDRTNLGTTDFVQKLNYQRALQGELGRTIKQIKEIEQARIHVVTPKESLFLEEQKKPTASIFIKARSGMTLGPAQVEGIVHLVASAVEGLEPGNITVVDTSGKILSKKSETSLLGQMTSTQLDYQRSIEEGLRKKVQGMLEEVLGLNKAIARISTDIDFQQVDITEERYDPNTIVRSEQKNTERSSTTTGTATGAGRIESSLDPKASKGKPQGSPDANPKAPEPTNANLSERQQETRNYEVSKINKRIKSPVGTLKKVSAAVIVDGSYKETADSKGNKTKQYLPRPPEEMKSIESIVKSAVGYSQERGDQIEVINMPFSWSIPEEESIKEKGEVWWKEYLKISYKPLVSLLLALLFIFFILRPLLKRRAFPQGEETALLEPTLARHALVPETAPASVAKPPEARDQTLQLVHSDPSKAVGIVKAWLNEKES